MPKRKAKILIVDDAQINRIILCELLRDQYQILEAEDGKKALEMIKEDKSIDLVLLDIVMPNMDGYQVLEGTTLFRISSCYYYFFRRRFDFYGKGL